LVYNVTLIVGKGFEGQLPYLGNGFGDLTLLFGIPTVGVEDQNLLRYFKALANLIPNPQNGLFYRSRRGYVHWKLVSFYES